MGKYLVYHVDKGLSFVPTETVDRLSFTAVGEDVHDQGDARICGEGTINQAFPRWNAAARAKPVSQRMRAPRLETYKPRKTSNIWGRR